MASRLKNRDWLSEAIATPEAVESPFDFAVRVGFVPDRWQNLLLSSGGNVIVNCSRQSGKSTTAGLLAAYTAISKPGSLILLASRSDRQSSELMRKVHHWLKAAGERYPDRARGADLPNGSRIEAIPHTEETIRGYSAVNLVIEDEASRVPDVLFYGLRPMLATVNGRFVLLSTPWGKRGHFYDIWQESNWLKLQITGEECSRISAEFLEEERSLLPGWAYRQEYCCEFVESVEGVFDEKTIAAAFGELEPLEV